jgi:hypothetical protein
MDEITRLHCIDTAPDNNRASIYYCSAYSTLLSKESRLLYCTVIYVQCIFGVCDYAQDKTAVVSSLLSWIRPRKRNKKASIPSVDLYSRVLPHCNINEDSWATASRGTIPVGAFHVSLRLVNSHPSSKSPGTIHTIQ